MPRKAVCDSGCISNFITKREAQEAGWHIHLFSPGQSSNIKYIEGAATSSSIGRTEALRGERRAGPWHR